MAGASSPISSSPTSPITSPPVSPRLHHPPSPYAAIPPSPYANIPPSPYANFSPTPYATANIPPSPYPPPAQREPERQPPAEPAVQPQSDSNPHPGSIKTEPTQPKAQAATRVSNSETCESVIQDAIIEIQQQTGNITMQTTGQMHWFNKSMWHTKIRHKRIRCWREFKSIVNFKVLMISIAYRPYMSFKTPLQRKSCLQSHECTLIFFFSGSVR